MAELIQSKTLKTIRLDKGMTQQEVANMIGISITSYNLIEQGRKIGRIETWKKLQLLFNINDIDMWNLIKDKRG